MRWDSLQQRFPQRTADHNEEAGPTRDCVGPAFWFCGETASACLAIPFSGRCVGDGGRAFRR